MLECIDFDGLTGEFFPEEDPSCPSLDSRRLLFLNSRLARLALAERVMLVTVDEDGGG